MHGEAENALRGVFGQGKTSSVPAHFTRKLSVDGLQVERRGIVHGGWNARAFEG